MFEPPDRIPKLLPGQPESYYFALVAPPGAWTLDLRVKSHSLYRTLHIPFVVELIDPAAGANELLDA